MHAWSYAVICQRKNFLFCPKEGLVPNTARSIKEKNTLKNLIKKPIKSMLELFPPSHYSYFTSWSEVQLEKYWAHFGKLHLSSEI